MLDNSFYPRHWPRYWHCLRTTQVCACVCASVWVLYAIIFLFVSCPPIRFFDCNPNCSVSSLSVRQHHFPCELIKPNDLLSIVSLHGRWQRSKFQMEIMNNFTSLIWYSDIFEQFLWFFLELKKLSKHRCFSSSSSFKSSVVPKQAQKSVECYLNYLNTMNTLLKKI